MNPNVRLSYLKRIAAALFILAAMILIALLLNNAMFSQPTTLSADYGQVTGAIGLQYGLNEEANWVDFADNAVTHSMHKEAGSAYIRVWLDDPPHRQGSSTIPYKDGNYDFTNLDRFVNAVLDSDAIPFMVFAYSPEELSQGQAVGNNDLPSSNAAFAAYCVAVVSHYDYMCKNGKLAKACDISDWYWEVWNEPYESVWWADKAYIELYNEAYRKIKSVAPAAKVGGYTNRFYTDEDKSRVKQFLDSAAGLDFISIHIYGNYPIPKAKDEIYIESLGNSYLKGLYDEEMIGNNRMLFYQDVLTLQDYVASSYHGAAPEIVVSELGPNWNWKYEPYLDDQYVAAWYASALYWLIQTNAVGKEMYYSGTSNLEDGGFAMWSSGSSDLFFRPYPVYFMKRDFVRYNPTGSLVYKTQGSTKSLEILAVSNPGGRYVTLINKKGTDQKDITVGVKGIGYTSAVDLGSGQALDGFMVDLKPYEVKFIQLK